MIVDAPEGALDTRGTVNVRSVWSSSWWIETVDLTFLQGCKTKNGHAICERRRCYSGESVLFLLRRSRISNLMQDFVIRYLLRREDDPEFADRNKFVFLHACQHIFWPIMKGKLLHETLLARDLQLIVCLKILPFCAQVSTVWLTTGNLASIIHSRTTAVTSIHYYYIRTPVSIMRKSISETQKANHP